MIQTLATIFKDNWGWRSQIGKLALFELKKKSRGAVLSWAWFFIKPGMYIFCFWFALSVGLRVGSGNAADGAPPYILWLCAGLIPWFFMQEMIGAGIDVLHRYPYLVNKIKFPISGISAIYTLAMLVIHLMLVAVLFAIYFLCGMHPDVYLLQVPLLLALMLLFWDAASIMFSQLSAISKDFANLMHALSTPLFWLSGVIFNVASVPVGWIQKILYFNPITFFVTSYRCAFYDKTWFWENHGMVLGFAAVCVVTVLAMAFVYKRLNEEVADVL